jgi:hypothetical protein
MSTLRLHIAFPEELAAEIDALADERGRSAFVVEAMRAEVKRRRMQAFLNDPVPAWKDEDHPELANGSAAWIRTLRTGKSDRQKRIAKKLAETS